MKVIGDGPRFLEAQDVEGWLMGCILHTCRSDRLVNPGPRIGQHQENLGSRVGSWGFVVSSYFQALTYTNGHTSLEDKTVGIWTALPGLVLAHSLGVSFTKRHLEPR